MFTVILALLAVEAAVFLLALVVQAIVGPALRRAAEEEAGTVERLRRAVLEALEEQGRSPGQNPLRVLLEFRKGGLYLLLGEKAISLPQEGLETLREAVRYLPQRPVVYVRGGGNAGLEAVALLASAGVMAKVMNEVGG